jgi:ribosome biogenesis protein ENP2
MLLSSTRKAIKINKIGGEDGSKGKLFTSVEPKSEINGF